MHKKYKYVATSIQKSHYYYCSIIIVVWALLKQDKKFGDKKC